MDKQFYTPIEEDFKISLSQNIRPQSRTLLKLDRCIVCICIAGSANIEINSVKHNVVRNEMIFLFPNQIISMENRSDDFIFAYFSATRRLLHDVLFHFPPQFVGYLRENFHRILPQEEYDNLYNDYFRIMHKKFNEKDNVCRREIILNTIRNFFLDDYNKAIKSSLYDKRQRKRKHELVENFINLLMENYTQSREVSFYAEKLYITPKYLSMVLKEQNGKTAKEWIDSYVVTEVKLLLKTTDLSIQEITYKLNFPNQSFLCKYFKAHTGLSPMHYRTI